MMLDSWIRYWCCGFQGIIYPSTRQRSWFGRTYKSSTRQVSRQEASATRQEIERLTAIADRFRDLSVGECTLPAQPTRSGFRRSPERPDLSEHRRGNTVPHLRGCW
jgi:hypothetical protein